MPRNSPKLGRGVHEWDIKSKDDRAPSFKQGIKYYVIVVGIELSCLFNQALQGIKDNAGSRQDNVLAEYLSSHLDRYYLYFGDHQRYECALIRNKLAHVPVAPFFIGEVNVVANKPESAPFKFAEHKFPDVPHKRNADTQKLIDELRYLLLLSINKY